MHRVVNEVVIDGGDRWGDLDAEEYAASRAPVFAGGVAPLELAFVPQMISTGQ